MRPVKAADKFNALAESRFRLFWIGRTTSMLGDAMMPVTIAFAVLSAGGSASDIGLVIASMMVVRMLLLLIGGAMADRLPRRLLLGSSDLFLCVIQAIAGVLLLAGHRSVALLLGAAVCYGAGSAIARPAIAGLVPQTVSREKLQQANGLMELSRGAAQVAGPAVAGLAVAASPGWVYLLDSLTFLVSAATLVFLPLPSSRRTGRDHILREIASGWSEVVQRPWYWLTLCGHALSNVGSSAFYVLGPVLISEQTGGAANWGLVSACMAIGALLGAAASMQYCPRRPLVVSHLMLLLSTWQLAALGAQLPSAVVMGAALASAAGVAYANSMWTTAFQRLIPEEVLSRVASYDWLISFTVAPLGYVAVGPLAEGIGAAATLGIALAFVVVGVATVLLIPHIRRLQQTGDGSFHGWPELDDVKPDNQLSTLTAAPGSR